MVILTIKYNNGKAGSFDVVGGTKEILDENNLTKLLNKLQNYRLLNTEKVYGETIYSESLATNYKSTVGGIERKSKETSSFYLIQTYAPK